MKQHYGIIELGKIENIGDNATQIDVITAQFVHFPDYQQLSIWLPEYGRQGYGNIRLINKKNNTIIDDKPVEERLNGTVQILWDTINIPPSEYAIEIEHPKGGKHILPFKKLRKGKLTTTQPNGHPSVSKPIKEEFTDMLPIENIISPTRGTNPITEQFKRRIKYEGSFRDGYINYFEGDLRLKFSHKLMGGDCKFYIEIPNQRNWELETKTPLSKRAEIIDFIALTVQNDHASNWQLEIREDSIYYY